MFSTIIVDGLCRWASGSRVLQLLCRREVGQRMGGYTMQPSGGPLSTGQKQTCCLHEGGTNCRSTETVSSSLRVGIVRCSSVDHTHHVFDVGEVEFDGVGAGHVACDKREDDVVCSADGAIGAVEARPGTVVVHATCTLHSTCM